MKPIKNFTNHPSLKYDSVQYIFTIKEFNKEGVYLVTERGVKRIIPESAQSTNIGEPYHGLARFYFHYPHPYNLKEQDDSTDIDLEDLPNLIIMLVEIGIDLPLDKELQKYIDNEE